MSHSSPWGNTLTVRFEPEYEDYSIVSFITSYLTGPDASFALPPPPYPTWLWPAIPSTLTLTRTITRERANTSAAPPVASPVLPFPHPLQSRKHPTMKLSFPVPTTSNIATPLSPSILNTNPLSRVITRGEKGEDENRPALNSGSSANSTTHPGINGATTIRANEEDLGNMEPSLGLAASALPARTLFPSAGTSPDRFVPGQQLASAPALFVSSTESPEAEAETQEMDMDEDDDEYEDDEEEEEDDEDDELQPTSQYISALDLAGY